MDIKILQWFDEVFHSQNWLNYIMKYITYIGEFGLGAIITAVVLFIFKKTRWAGVSVGAAFVVDVLIVNVILKSAVNRTRPWVDYPDLGFHEFHQAIGVREPSDSSFPSGHTAALFAAAAALIMYYRVKGLPALGVALVVALSRIYLCMHYPSDVLGGMLIGTACGIAGYFIAKYAKKFLDDRRDRMTPIVEDLTACGESEVDIPPPEEENDVK